MPESNLDYRMECLIEELDGVVMEAHELESILAVNADLMRQAYKKHGELLFIARGMNDGDMAFTVTARWERP